MVISASLQACGVVFPFAMLTSICRSIVTICSGLYLLIGMTSYSSKWILSHSTWYNFCRSRQRLQTHPGVGSLTALAFVLIIGRAERFQCGKQIASYLGLVPSEDSSGCLLYTSDAADE